MDIILASKSPRRIEMMNELGFPYRVIASSKDESADTSLKKEDFVMELARNKAFDVYESNKDSIVLGFDTLVFYKDERLGKPKDEDDCIRMIKMLSGNTHEVITGAFIKYGNKEYSFYRNCFVEFGEIEEDEIIAYSKTKEPYDKAGAYAVQGFVGRFIKRVEGDFFSVIGMPKSEVYRILKELIK